MKKIILATAVFICWLGLINSWAQTDIGPEERNKINAEVAAHFLELTPREGKVWVRTDGFYFSLNDNSISGPVLISIGDKLSHPDDDGGEMLTLRNIDPDGAVFDYHFEWYYPQRVEKDARLKIFWKNSEEKSARFIDKQDK